jgi:hypothetical protein
MNLDQGNGNATLGRYRLVGFASDLDESLQRWQTIGFSPRKDSYGVE